MLALVALKGGSEMAATYLQKLRLFSRDVRLYLIAAALSGFTVDGVHAVLMNLYLLRLGHGPEFIGLVNAAGALAFTLFCLPAGALGKRWGSRRIMIVGVSLMMAGGGLLPLVEFIPATWQAEWLLATNMLAGLGLALYYVNGIPFLMVATDPEERNHAFSVQMALAPLAGFVGSLVGGTLPRVLATMLGVSLDGPVAYRYPLLGAALLLFPGVLALTATREMRAERGPEHMRETGRGPYGLIVLIGLIVVLRLAGYGVTSTFFNVYLDAGLHTSTALIGALSAARQLLSVPAALIAPLLVARWGNGRTIAVGSLGIALSMLPLALIPHWSTAGLGFLGVTALFSMTAAPLRVYSQEIVSPGWRAAMSGVVMMGAGLSTSAVAFGGGYLITTWDYPGLFLTGAGLTAAGALFFWAYFRVSRGDLTLAT
jgi:MFS family permease